MIKTEVFILQPLVMVTDGGTIGVAKGGQGARPPPNQNTTNDKKL